MGVITLPFAFKPKKEKPLALEFKNISFGYAKKTILRDVSFTAEAGEITCLLGPSGCGKTTLLKLAAGILTPQQGCLNLDGQLMASKENSPPPEKRPVGLVFQEGALFPHLTVRQNVAFGLKGADQADIVSGLLEQTGMSDWADSHPHTLSGGQQQRVALARSIAPQPRVLLLDEPFASVDIVIRRKLREEARALLKRQNAVSIMVTHDPDEAVEIADKIVVMDAGRVLQSGPPRELYENPIAAAVGQLLGEGQIVEADLQNDELVTAFGNWDLSSLKNELPSTGRIDLLVRPDCLNFSTQGAGCRLMDQRFSGAGLRLLLEAPSGERLWVLAPLDETAQIGTSGSITPGLSSIFAFSKDE